MSFAKYAPLLPATLVACTLAPFAEAQSIRAYGKGTPGTGGKIPALWVTSTPRPGNSGYGLSIERGRPSATAAVFLSGQRASAVIGGVSVWIDFATAVALPAVTLDASGNGTAKLPLPNTPSLIGGRILQQAFVFDAGGAALGFSATQGLDTTVTSFGLLLGTRSTGRTNQPQIAIDLDTGRQTTFSTPNQTNVGYPDIYPNGGSHAVMGSGRTKKIALFDARVFPPRLVKEVGSTNTPWAVSWTPDGLRLYVVEQGPRGSNPHVRVLWGNPLAPNFGQPFPGGKDIALGAVIDALRMDFTSDGSTGILATLGLFGGGADVRRYDTKLGSPTFHKQTGNVIFRGRFIWDMCRVDDGRFAVGVSGFGTQVAVHIIDIVNMKIQKTISGAFGAVIRGIVAGPRGKFVYVGNAPATRFGVKPGVVRINVDPQDPKYGQTTNISAGMAANWSVYDVEITDAGDKIYAIAGNGIQTGFVGQIIEFDAVTLRKGRSWNMNRLGNLYNLVIR